MKAILAWVMAALLIVPAAASAASRDADRRGGAVLQQYKRAIERLDASGTQRLFAADSQIFKTGGSEGRSEGRWTILSLHNSAHRPKAL